MPEGGSSGVADREAVRPARRLQAWLAEVGQWLRPSSVLEYSDEVAADQVALLSRLCLLSSVFGTGTVVLIATEFRERMDLSLLAAVVLIPLLYGLLLLLCAQKMMARNCTRVFLRRAVILLGFIGSAWGLLVLGAALNATPEQKDLVGALMVGLMSTPIITVPFSAATAFFIPCSLACVLTLSLVFKPFDPYLLFCFISYLGFAYFSTVLLNRFSLDRTVARLRLQHQNEITSLLLRSKENAIDWSWEVDANLRFRNISRRFAAALKTTPACLRDTPLRALAGTGEPISGLGPLIGEFDKRQAFRDLVIGLETASETRWWSFTGQPLYDANAHFVGYRGTASDITELRRSEARIRYLANHDSLTGLPNRAHFIAQLEALCREGQEAPNPSFALLMLDLDRFKEVNDTYGHPVGDALLVAIAGRLGGVLRSGDSAFRLGGDEFAIILNISEWAEAGIVADRIIRTLEEPYFLQDVTVRPGSSIGLTFITDAGQDPDPATLMRNADLALYKAKAAGGGAWRTYQPGMEAEQVKRAGLRNDLKSAGEAEFTVEYQPIIDIATNQVVAAEALVRWDHPTRGRIDPSLFIPVAEDSGLIVALGAEVLSTACRAATAWPADVAVAVNVSAVQMRDPDFLRIVDRVLSASALAPNRLEMELTERILLNEDGISSRIIRDLLRRGVRVVMDDFGTGYSSLGALMRFQFGGVKIDRDFTARIEIDEKARAIVGAIGRIATDLELRVTAEGVETMGQLQLLSQLRISRAQGFLICHPQAGEALLSLIEERGRRGLVRAAKAAPAE
jgi:diguanylate cyclase (GGDEF)-like protein